MVINIDKYQQVEQLGKQEFAGEIMIILVTGASHTGKTALTQKLLEKYQILWHH